MQKNAKGKDNNGLLKKKMLWRMLNCIKLQQAVRSFSKSVYPVILLNEIKVYSAFQTYLTWDLFTQYLLGKIYHRI